jgi:hypothetical protein
MIADLQCYRDGAAVFVHEFHGPPSSLGYRVLQDVPASLDPSSVQAYDGNNFRPSLKWFIDPPITGGLYDLSSQLRDTNVVVTSDRRSIIVTGSLVELLPGACLVKSPTDERIVHVTAPSSISCAWSPAMHTAYTSRIRGMNVITFHSQEQTARLSYGCTGVVWHEKVYLYPMEADLEHATFDCAAMLYAEVVNRTNRDIKNARVVSLYGGNSGPNIHSRQRSFSGQYAEMATVMTAPPGTHVSEPEYEREVGLLYRLHDVTIMANQELTYHIDSKPASTNPNCYIVYYVDVASRFGVVRSCLYDLVVPVSPWGLATASKISVLARTRDGTKLMINAASPQRPISKGGRLAITLGEARDVEIVTTETTQQAPSEPGRRTPERSTQSFSVRNQKRPNTTPVRFEVRLSAIDIDSIIDINVDGQRATPVARDDRRVVEFMLERNKLARVTITYQEKRMI